MRVSSENRELDVTVLRGREGSVKVLIMSWADKLILELDWSEFFGWRLLEKRTGNPLPVDLPSFLEERGLLAMAPHLADPRALLLSFQVMES